MFFVTSKIFWFVFNPFNFIMIILFISWYFVLTKKYQIGKYLLTAGIIIIFILGFSPLSSLLIRKMEERVSRGIVNENVDGIIVLSGMLMPMNNRPGLIELSGGADRIIEGIRLAKKLPEAKLIVSGGSGFLDQAENLKEADYLKELALNLGITNKRIIVERESRNTHESALEVARILKKEKSGQWVLITSAFHMPRAIGCYKKEGVNVIPFPVDYYTQFKKSSGISICSFFPRMHSIMRMGMFFHEVTGLIAYRVSGYTDRLFPTS